MLQQHCNDLPINDEKLQALVRVNESDDDDTSSDEDDQDIRIQTLEDVKDPIYQGHILDECNSTWANSVQVTLLGGKQCSFSGLTCNLKFCTRKGRQENQIVGEESGNGGRTRCCIVAGIIVAEKPDFP